MPKAVARLAKQVTDGVDISIKEGDLDNAKRFLAHADRVPGGAVPFRTRMRWFALINFPRLMVMYHRLRTSKEDISRRFVLRSFATFADPPWH